MSETKFTKSEWVVETGSFSGNLLVVGGGDIAQVIFRGEKATKANAHLIAASPRMYAYIAKKAEEGDVEAIELINSILC